MLCAPAVPENARPRRSSSGCAVPPVGDALGKGKMQVAARARFPPAPVQDFPAAHVQPGQSQAGRVFRTAPDTKDKARNISASGPWNIIFEATRYASFSPPLARATSSRCNSGVTTSSASRCKTQSCFRLPLASPKFRWLGKIHKVVLQHARSAFLCQIHRAIRAERIHHQHVIRPFHGIQTTWRGLIPRCR